MVDMMNRNTLKILLSLMFIVTFIITNSTINEATNRTTPEVSGIEYSGNSGGLKTVFGGLSEVKVDYKIKLKLVGDKFSASYKNKEYTYTLCSTKYVAGTDQNIDSFAASTEADLEKYTTDWTTVAGYIKQAMDNNNITSVVEQAYPRGSTSYDDWITDLFNSNKVASTKTIYGCLFTNLSIKSNPKEGFAGWEYKDINLTRYFEESSEKKSENYNVVSNNGAFDLRAYCIYKIGMKVSGGPVVNSMDTYLNYLPKYIREYRMDNKFGNFSVDSIASTIKKTVDDNLDGVPSLAGSPNFRSFLRYYLHSPDPAPGLDLDQTMAKYVGRIVEITSSLSPAWLGKTGHIFRRVQYQTINGDIKPDEGKVDLTIEYIDTDDNNKVLHSIPAKIGAGKVDLSIPANKGTSKDYEVSGEGLSYTVPAIEPIYETKSMKLEPGKEVTNSPFLIDSTLQSGTKYTLKVYLKKNTAKLNIIYMDGGNNTEMGRVTGLDIPSMTGGSIKVNSDNTVSGNDTSYLDATKIAGFKSKLEGKAVKEMKIVKVGGTPTTVQASVIPNVTIETGKTYDLTLTYNTIDFELSVVYKFFLDGTEKTAERYEVKLDASKSILMKPFSIKKGDAVLHAPYYGPNPKTSSWTCFFNDAQRAEYTSTLARFDGYIFKDMYIAKFNASDTEITPKVAIGANAPYGVNMEAINDANVKKVQIVFEFKKFSKNVQLTYKFFQGNVEETDKQVKITYDTQFESRYTIFANRYNLSIDSGIDTPRVSYSQWYSDLKTEEKAELALKKPANWGEYSFSKMEFVKTSASGAVTTTPITGKNYTVPAVLGTNETHNFVVYMTRAGGDTALLNVVYKLSSGTTLKTVPNVIIPVATNTYVGVSENIPTVLGNKVYDQSKITDILDRITGKSISSLTLTPGSFSGTTQVGPLNIVRNTTYTLTITYLDKLVEPSTAGLVFIPHRVTSWTKENVDVTVKVTPSTKTDGVCWYDDVCTTKASAACSTHGAGRGLHYYPCPSGSYRYCSHGNSSSHVTNDCDGPPSTCSHGRTGSHDIMTNGVKTGTCAGPARTCSHGYTGYHVISRCSGPFDRCTHGKTSSSCNDNSHGNNCSHGNSSPKGTTSDGREYCNISHNNVAVKVADNGIAVKLINNAGANLSVRDFNRGTANTTSKVTVTNRTTLYGIGSYTYNTTGNTCSSTAGIAGTHKLATNQATGTSGEYLIDKEPPEITVTGNPNRWTNQDVTLNISITDTGGSGVDSAASTVTVYKVGNATQTAFTQTGVYTGAAHTLNFRESGIYRIDIVGKDNAKWLVDPGSTNKYDPNYIEGEPNSSRQSVMVYIDKKAPVINYLMTDSGFTWANGRWEITQESIDNGNDRIKVQIEDQNWAYQNSLSGINTQTYTWKNANKVPISGYENKVIASGSILMPDVVKQGGRGILEITATDVAGNKTISAIEFGSGGSGPTTNPGVVPYNPKTGNDAPELTNPSEPVKQPAIEIFVIGFVPKTEDVGATLAITKVYDIKWGSTKITPTQPAYPTTMAVYQNEISDAIGLGYRVDFRMNTIGYGKDNGDSVEITVDLYGKVGSAYKKLNLTVPGETALGRYKSFKYVKGSSSNPSSFIQWITKTASVGHRIGTEVTQYNSLEFNYFIPATAKFTYDSSTPFTGSEIAVVFSEIKLNKNGTTALGMNYTPRAGWTRTGEMETTVYGKKKNSVGVNGQVFWYDIKNTALTDIGGGETQRN